MKLTVKNCLCCCHFVREKLVPFYDYFHDKYYRNTIFHTVSRDLHGSHDHSEKESKRVGQSQIILYALCVIFSGDFIYWSNGLGYGIWIFFTAFLLVAMGYFCMTVCMAEINSCIPFAGGSYGFIRIAVSPMMGYITACNDRLHAGLLFGRSMVMIARIITRITATEKEENYEPFYWLAIIIITVVVFLQLKEKFWQFTRLQAILSMCFLVFFFIIACQDLNFAQHAYGDTLWIDHNQEYFANDETGIKAVLRCIPMAMMMFNGLELLACTAGCVKNPRLSIPRASMITFAVSFVVGFVLLFTVASHTPSMNTFVTKDLALNAIWSNGLGLSSSQTAVFSLVPCIAGLIASCYAIDKISSSMQQSKYTLLAKWEPAIQQWLASLEKPKTAIAEEDEIAAMYKPPQYLYYARLLHRHGSFFFSLLFTYVLALICYFFANDVIWTISCFTVLISLGVHAGIYVSYLQLHYVYSSLKKKYHFVYGLYCAFLGLFLMSLFYVAILVFASVNSVIGLMTLGLSLLGIWKFSYFVVKHQTFSEDEELILFAVHVVKANKDRHKRVLHHRRQSRHSIDFSVMSSFSQVSHTSHHTTPRRSSVFFGTKAVESSNGSQGSGNHDNPQLPQENLPPVRSSFFFAPIKQKSKIYADGSESGGEDDLESQKSALSQISNNQSSAQGTGTGTAMASSSKKPPPQIKSLTQNFRASKLFDIKEDPTSVSISARRIAQLNNRVVDEVEASIHKVQQYFKQQDQHQQQGKEPLSPKQQPQKAAQAEQELIQQESTEPVTQMSQSASPPPPQLVGKEDEDDEDSERKASPRKEKDIDNPENNAMVRQYSSMMVVPICSDDIIHNEENKHRVLTNVADDSTKQSNFPPICSVPDPELMVASFSVSQKHSNGQNRGSFGALYPTASPSGKFSPSPERHRRGSVNRSSLRNSLLRASLTLFTPSNDEYTMDVEAVAAKLSSHNAMLQRHLSVRGSCDELDPNAYLDEIFHGEESTRRSPSRSSLPLRLSYTFRTQSQLSSSLGDTNNNNKKEEVLENVEH